MNILRHLQIPLGCLLIFCLFGCAGAKKKQDAYDLELTLMRFEKTIRWGDFGAANAMRDPEIRTPVPDDNNYDRIRVTSYQVIQPPFVNADGLTEVLMVINYVHEDTQIEKSIKYKQLWRQVEKGENWLLMSDLPVFK